MGDPSAEPRDAVSERDDGLHEHGGTPGWAERLTFTFFDPAARFGGIVRMSLRPLDGSTDATLNLFIADREVATVIAKGTFEKVTEVGRILLEPAEPLRGWRLRCEDMALIMSGGGAAGLAPATERKGAAARIEVDLAFDAWTPPAGGVERKRSVDEMNFVQVTSHGRFVQGMRAHGRLRIGGVQASIDGTGVRERAWGNAVELPAQTAWIAAAFGPTLAVSFRTQHIGGDTEEGSGSWLTDRSVHEALAVVVERETEGRAVRRFTARATAAGDRHQITGEVRSTIPINDGGRRIRQSLVAYTLGARECWGLAEFTPVERSA